VSGVRYLPSLPPSTELGDVTHTIIALHSLNYWASLIFYLGLIIHLIFLKK
jgi:hypothetical protein